MALVDSYKLNDLLDYASLTLASIGIEDVYELLTINERQDGFTVLDNMITDAIDRVDYLEPLTLKIFVELQAGVPYEFTDNFDLYLNGKVQRTGLQMIPRKIVSVSEVYLGTKRGIVYEPPTIIEHNLTGRYAMNIFCNRPVIRERFEQRYTDDSKVYYLGRLSKPQLNRFKELFVTKLCSHIIRLDENTEHPNIPITTFNGLQNFYSELKSKNENDYEISHGYAGVYS